MHHRVRILSGLRQTPVASNVSPLPSIAAPFLDAPGTSIPHNVLGSLSRWSSRPMTFPLQSTTSSIESVHPTDTNGDITFSEETCFSGGFGDVWVAQWEKGTERRTVAVKIPRPHVDKHDLNQRLRREIQVWRRLQHDNIVPLLGVIGNFGPYASTGMVSPWMEHGNLNQFQRTEDLSVQFRLQILCDVAAGLVYLHTTEIIHGDLTGTNILIDENRNACLTGFGLSAIKAEFEGSSYWSSTVNGSMRYRAPELLPPIDGDLYDFAPIVTSACDIYSLGSVMLQTLSGKVPYQDIKSDIYVLLTLAHGTRPRRPKGHLLTDIYWEFINHCWGTTPGTRPAAESVHIALKGFRGLCNDPPRKCQLSVEL